jgi:hypothetical protein
MGGERLATEKRQSCYAMPESSLQYAVPSAKKEKAGGEGSGKRLWENRKWQKFFRQVSLKIGNSGAQQRLDPPLPTTVGFIAAGSGPRRAVIWLHGTCWPGWHQLRRAEAIAALPKSEDQPRAKQIGHAPQPAVWSADNERQPLPVSGDAERPLPDTDTIRLKQSRVGARLRSCYGTRGLL